MTNLVNLILTNYQLTLTMTRTQVSEKVSTLKNLHLQEDQYIEAQFPLIC